MKIFVCGKLGEVVKKVVELEDLIGASPTNVIFVKELAEYQMVLNAWPVIDKNMVEQAIQIFKYSILMLKEKEKELRSTSTGILHTLMSTKEYLEALDRVRENMQYMNEIGMYVGDTAILEVEDV